MKSFAATYIPHVWHPESGLWSDDTKSARKVLVLCIVPVEGQIRVVFVDSDGRLRSDDLECFWDEDEPPTSPEDFGIKEPK